MDPVAALKAVALGILEGATEFLPVSSTGHLLLAEHFLGLSFADERFDKTFAVLIQFGSILALLSVYFRKLLSIAMDLPSDPRARTFVIGVLVAFLPAAVLGAALHGFIKDVLFNPLIVCIALILGGFVLMVVDRIPLPKRYTDVSQFSIPMALKIGVCQCFAMIPGVSRSGATIVGAMLFGADKRSAAEFSFFLAMPTMAGAFAYDLYKSRDFLDMHGVGLIVVGFLAAFLSGLVVVKSLLAYVGKHGFGVFAWWRIIVGAAGLAGLLVLG